MGQRAPTPGKRKHNHRSGREQSRSGGRAARQARCNNSRRRGLRKGGESTVFRDQRQDGGERQGALHCNREEASN